MRHRLAVLLLLAAPVTASAAPSSREELLYFHCRNGGGEYTAKMTTEVKVARAFLDTQLSDDENLRLAAQHQLRYFWGITRADPKWRARMQVVLSRKDPTFTIVAKREVPYGRDLVLDWPRTEERLKIEPGYIARAVARGRVGRDDPALAATVEMQFEVALCAHAEQPGAALKTPLPDDPWLLHWLVPRREFRTLRYYNTVDTTTPCADDDFADLPAPYYYWYDWYPTRRGRDIKGRRFDCTRLLRPGRDYRFYTMTLQPTRLASNQLAALADEARRIVATRPLRATIVIGVLDHTVTSLDYAAWQTKLGQGRGILDERARAARTSFTDSRVHERGMAMLLLTLDELVKLLDDIEHRTTVEGTAELPYLVTEVKGRFRKSGAPVQLRFVLGMTDVFGPKPPAHWQYLWRGLVEDDVVLYWGHSGIGENFRLAQIGRHLGKTAVEIQQALERAPMLLVAFISCYSYMYFGEDLVDAARQRPQPSTFLFTGMGEVVHDRGPLPLFELFDRLLDRTQSTEIKALPIGDEELWILKRLAR